MTVQELLDNLNSWGSAEREEPIIKLAKHFTTISLKQLRDFQNDWNTGLSYDEFVAAQNKVIVVCIMMEISNLGKMVREALGKKPLTLETELK